MINSKDARSLMLMILVLMITQFISTIVVVQRLERIQPTAQQVQPAETDPLTSYGITMDGVDTYTSQDSIPLTGDSAWWNKIGKPAAPQNGNEYGGY